MTREDAFAEGLKRLAHWYPYLRLDLDWETGIAILACLQLSLRHPGPTAAAARAFCDGLLRKIEGVAPELAALLRLGDDPTHDEPRWHR